MHIPDGLINDPRVWIAGDAVAAAAVGYAVHRENRRLRPEAVPVMGLMAAFVYAGQLFNVPVAAGVSGHFLGAVFAAVLLGPCQATLVMAAVITLQCLLHADGGLTALGLNVTNMGVVGTMLGYGIYWAIRRLAAGTSGLFVGAAVAAWCSVVGGAALVSLQVVLCQEAYSAAVVFPPMLGIHAVIGLLEAAVTVAALTVVWRVRPDLLGLWPPAPRDSAAEEAAS